jgi:hypothetical protein
VTHRGRTTLALDAPPDGRIAPPGYYMLFLVSADGVPSVARFVRLEPNGRPTPPVVRAHLVGRRVTLSWSGASARYGIRSYIVSRDGVTRARTATKAYTEKLRPRPARHVYVVRPVDSLGSLGLPSKAIRIRAARPALRGRPKLRRTRNVIRIRGLHPSGSRPLRITYRWLRDGRIIRGARGSSHRLVEADRGHRLRVRIALANDFGHLALRTASLVVH